MQEILSVLIALAAVIGLIYLTLYITKRLMKKFNFSQSGGIKIVSSAGVGQDKSIIAVKAGGKNLLLGVTASEISVLAELDDEDMAAMEVPAESSSSENKSFGEIFAENMKKQFGGKKDGKQ